MVTIAFQADVDEQAGAYATGVLALMTSAAIAVFLTELRRGHRRAAAFFAVVSAIFVYTFVVTIVERPEGLLIALLFIAMILIVSVASRISRSTELRVRDVVYDEGATALLDRTSDGRNPLRFIANKLQAGDDSEYDEKSLEVRVDNHLKGWQKALFIEVEITDASDFDSPVLGALGQGRAARDPARHRHLRAQRPGGRVPRHPRPHRHPAARLLRVERSRAGRQRAALPPRR